MYFFRELRSADSWVMKPGEGMIVHREIVSSPITGWCARFRASGVDYEMLADITNSIKDRASTSFTIFIGLTEFTTGMAWQFIDNNDLPSVMNHLRMSFVSLLQGAKSLGKFDHWTDVSPHIHTMPNEYLKQLFEGYYYTHEVREAADLPDDIAKLIQVTMSNVYHSKGISGIQAYLSAYTNRSDAPTLRPVHASEREF